MNNEKILKMKKLISSQLKNRQYDFLQKQKEEFYNMLNTDIKEGKISEDEYNILIEYINSEIKEMLRMSKEDSKKKPERNFEDEFKERVIGRISFITKEEAYQILKDYSEQHELFKEPVQQIMKETRENQAEEFRKRIVIEKNDKAINKKSKELKVMEVRDNKINEIRIRETEQEQEELRLIDINEKGKKRGIKKKAKAYDGTMINLKLEKEENKGEER